MELGLKGRKVLVVGAGRGIGREIALGFAEEGTEIVAVARNRDRLAEVEAEALGRGALAFHAVFKDILEGKADDFAQKLLEIYGDFEVVVHCVGGSPENRDALAGAPRWAEALQLNALAAIDMNCRLIPPMVRKGWGRVIHLSSTAAVLLRGNPLYAVAKAFLNAYVTAAGRQLAPAGVSLCSVMPGAVAFPGSSWDTYTRTDPGRCEDFLRHHQAAGRFGRPEEIAAAVIFLASEKASFWQAANVPVDGGNM